MLITYGEEDIPFFTVSQPTIYNIKLLTFSVILYNEISNSRNLNSDSTHVLCITLFDNFEFGKTLFFPLKSLQKVKKKNMECFCLHHNLIFSMWSINIFDKPVMVAHMLQNSTLCIYWCNGRIYVFNEGKSFLSFDLFPTLWFHQRVCLQQKYPTLVLPLWHMWKCGDAG